MKKWFFENKITLCIVGSFLLYWLFGAIISYLIIGLVTLFIIWGRLFDRIEFYKVDILLYISYMLFSIILIFFSNSDSKNILVIVFGLLYLNIFFKEEKIKKVRNGKK